MKRFLKIWIVTFAVIILVGMTGFVIHIIDFSQNYDLTRDRLGSLQTKVDKLTYRLFEQEAQLTEYDLLKFKSFSLTRKYPRFSSIVEAVYNKSREFGLNPSLILGIIQVESNFNPTAVSNRGAYGLMQINKNVWDEELSIRDEKIFDIDYNLDLGLTILKRYLRVSNGDLHQALHYYNNGFKYNNTKYPYMVMDTTFLRPAKTVFKLSQKP